MTRQVPEVETKSTNLKMTVSSKHDNLQFKGIVHPKMKILSVFTHPHVVPTP